MQFSLLDSRKLLSKDFRQATQGPAKIAISTKAYTFQAGKPRRIAIEGGPLTRALPRLRIRAMIGPSDPFRIMEVLQRCGIIEQTNVGLGAKGDLHPRGWLALSSCLSAPTIGQRLTPAHADRSSNDLSSRMLNQLATMHRETLTRRSTD
ncbi:MAG: hypothetical protein ACI87E_001900 [Mariniblastus sp.]|jgi:hypothetical protein